MKKRLLALFLCLAVGVILCACAGKGTDTSGGSQSPDTSAPAAGAKTDRADSSATAKKVLVAYFSATGNTERVAKDIAAATEADLFAITPAGPYSAADLNYNDEASRVSREHKDESLRSVPLTVTVPENWAQYDVVFIGYPIWWGIAAWPVNGFVSGNDFAGKTVIPFATSASSGLGSSDRQLADLAGGGNWLEGQRFSPGTDTADVQKWVGGLNLDH